MRGNSLSIDQPHIPKPWAAHRVAATSARASEVVTLATRIPNAIMPAIMVMLITSCSAHQRGPRSPKPVVVAVVMICGSVQVRQVWAGVRLEVHPPALKAIDQEQEPWTHRLETSTAHPRVGVHTRARGIHASASLRTQ